MEDGGGTCLDMDNGAADSYGDPCSSYTATPVWCTFAGEYDDFDFTSSTMCCACGGGERPEGSAGARAG